jgi:histone deacetylase 1/2
VSGPKYRQRICATTYIPASEHARFVYNLQQADTSDSDDLDSSRWDSDESTSTRRTHYRRNYIPKSTNKRRMSLLSGQYFDVPVHDQGYGHYEHGAPTKAGKRRFFKSEARWDEVFERVLVAKQGITNGMPRSGSEPEVSDDGTFLTEMIPEDEWEGSVASVVLDS